MPVRPLVSPRPALPILVASLCGIAAAQQDASAPTRDILTLHTGGFIDGVLVEEGPESLVIEIAPGARIEVARTDVAQIRRADGNRKTAESRPAVRVETGTWWFVLRNASGQDVGVRERRVGPEPGHAGELRFEETVTLFDEDQKTIRVHRIETCDADLQALECHYREMTEGDSAVVTANLRGGKLVVETLDDCGRARFEVANVKGLTFPLLFHERARRMQLKDGQVWESDVFDPFVRTIVRRTARGGSPSPIVLGDGGAIFYDTLVTTARGVESTVWLRGPGDVAREELNGADLVAVRSTEEVARQAITSRRAAPWIASDAYGRVQACLPNEDWRFEAAEADSIALTRKSGASTIVLTVLDVQSEVTAVGAALVLERRLQRTLPRMKRDGDYEEGRLGNHPIVRFEFTCEGEKGSLRGAAVAIRGKRGVGAGVLTGPPDDTKSDRRDFDRLLNRAEFRF